MGAILRRESYLDPILLLSRFALTTATMTSIIITTNLRLAAVADGEDYRNCCLCVETTTPLTAAVDGVA